MSSNEHIVPEGIERNAVESEGVPTSGLRDLDLPELNLQTAPITREEITTVILEVMNPTTGVHIPEKGKWIFFSGFDFDEANVLQVLDFIKHKVPDAKYINQVLPVNHFSARRVILAGMKQMDDYWAKASEAYARMVSGDVYIIMPKNAIIDRPRGIGWNSNWGDIELPILTLTGKVDAIFRVDVEDYRIWEEPVWKRGDAVWASKMKWLDTTVWSS